jgi:hypothetical protein
MIHGSWATCACAAGTTSTECDLGRVYEKVCVLLPTLSSQTIKVQGAKETGATAYDLYTYNPADGHVDQMITESGNGGYYCIFPIGGFQYIKFVCSSTLTGTFYCRGVRS